MRPTSSTLPTLTVTASDTLTTLAAKINDDTTLNQYFEAEVIPEGGGERLRIKHRNGEEMVVTEQLGTSVLSALGLAKGTVGLSTVLTVRSDIVDAPQKISRALPQYSNDLQKYSISTGDNTVANKLSDLFSENVAFDLAGNLSGTERTLADYSATLIACNAHGAATIQAQLDYQSGLHKALDLKSSEISAVNLDEELSKLMVYQQAYTAAAKVIQTTQAMLDVLNNLIR